MMNLFVIAFDEQSGQVVVYVPIEAVEVIESSRDRIVSILADVTFLCDEGRWPIDRGKAVIHFIPKDDMIVHNVESATCRCGPSMEYNSTVVVHSPLDGRKRFHEASVEERKAFWLGVKGHL